MRCDDVGFGACKQACRHIGYFVYGEYADILVRNEQLVFVRQYNKEAVIAAFNIADTAVSLDFEWQGEKYAVELAPHDSRVIVKE